MDNKKIKLIVFLTFYTIFVVFVVLFVLNREAIIKMLTAKQVVSVERDDGSILYNESDNVEENNEGKEIAESIEINETKVEESVADIDSLQMPIYNEIDTNENKYDEYGLLDIDMFDKEIIENNAELFQKYIGFVDAVHKGEGVKYTILNLKYIQSLYEKTGFFGDSNVIRFADQRILSQDKIVGFRGLALRELSRLVEDVDLKRYDNIVLWTGYVIKYIKNAEHYVSEYENVIKRIREQNETANIYVCSLLPASKMKMEEDLKNGSPHNIYLGPTYDKALEEHFKDQYINTKIFVNDDMYIEDGYHMKYEFYQLITAYVGFYINLMKLK